MQYQTLETLAAAHQDDLRGAAERRRRERLARSGRPSADRFDVHAHPTAHHPADGRLAGLRLRLGHLLVSAGTFLEGAPTEDAARSHGA